MLCFFCPGVVGDLGGAVGPRDRLRDVLGGCMDQYGTLRHACGHRAGPGGHTGRLLDLHGLSMSSKSLKIIEIH